MHWQDAAAASPTACAYRVDQRGWRYTRHWRGGAVVCREDGRVRPAQESEVEGHLDWEPTREEAKERQADE